MGLPPGERRNMIEAKKAIDYLRAGLSVLPANRAQKRPCLPRWSEFQKRLPTEPEVGHWFANKHDAICVVCGEVSGNLEVIDFDNHGELFPKWKEAIPGDLLAKLVIEQTPSGGYHVAYRCKEPISGNMKLAQGERDSKMVTLAETRGKGGLVLCAPTEGYELRRWDYDALLDWLRTEVYPKAFPAPSAEAAKALVCAFVEIMRLIMSVPLEQQPMVIFEIPDFADAGRKAQYRENR